MGVRVAIPQGLTPQTVRPPTGERLRLEGRTMAVVWSAQVIAPADLAETLRAAVQARLDAVVAQMSQWVERSAVNQFNRAPAGVWAKLPEDFWIVLRAGLRLAEQVDGAFDPTLGRLVDLWGFGAARRGQAPSQPEIDEALAQAGWRRLTLDEAGRRVRQPGGLALDFSGIAKGFGVDAAAATLQAHGVSSYLVEIGGELRGAGVKPDGQPWWVGIEAPPDLPAAPAPIRVALHGCSIATSGDYRRVRIEDGQRLAHTLDPRTGRPLPQPPVSVSVIHQSCMWADAICTALTVLGPQQGMAFAATNGVAARMILHDGAEHLSPAFEAMLA